MYDEDAGVGKLDGYVISVVGAGRLIGEKHLVRIEKVGRSSASAVLVDPSVGATGGPDGSGSTSASGSSSGDPADGEAAEEVPKRRRRGSRGGRGRRKAESASE